MRTTLDIPDDEHALFTSLARERRVSFSKLILSLARRGLQAPALPDAAPAGRIDPETGLTVFQSPRPVTLDDVKAMEDDELVRYDSPA
ncbi:MAG: hypothetical protein KDI75_07405 [Xanthomonadales bacterium]|nr:hypothetical protein [Xanthomonadales bacterium]